MTQPIRITDKRAVRKKSGWSRSLFAKFLLILIPVFIVSVIPGVWLMVGHELREDQELLAARIGNHAARTALALERNLSAETGAAQDLISILAVDRAFLCASIDNAVTGKALLTQPQGIPCSESVGGSMITVPVGENEEMALHVRYTDAELKEAGRRQLSIVMIVVAVAFVVALLASTAGFRFIVNRPLSLLLSSIRQSARTGHRTPVPKRGDDELNRVIGAFNEMLERDVKRERSLEETNARLYSSEAALRRVNEDLEERVRERTAKLVEANQAKSRFLATMSHELRTPLNSIIGFSDLMIQQGFGPLGNERYRVFAEDIQAGGRHLLALINDILDISKIEAGTVVLSETLFGVAAMATESLRMVEPVAVNKSVALNQTPIDPGLSVTADHTKLRQVLINILTNAIKFTPAGGRVELDISGNPRSGITFRVTDNGIGMSDDEIPKALEPFVQIDNETSRTQEGTGLGLPMADMLMKLHGGSLEIRSAPGQGTQVIMVLPPERTMSDNAAALTAGGLEFQPT